MPAAEAVAKITVKGSKFISTIVPVLSKEEAEVKYLAIKKKYYDATHNCFAYRIDAQTFRFSDDGEPSGTAGRPILQVLEGSGLWEVLCVVTRYFGGTKLGTGGLIRAYSEAAKQALKNVTIKEKVRLKSLKVQVDYAHEKFVFRLLSEFEGRVIKSNYAQGVWFLLELPYSKAEPFFEKLTQLTNGQAQLVET